MRSPLLFFDLTRPAAHIVDDLVRLWMGIVVPFFVSAKRSRVRTEGIGSGFLVFHEQAIFLVTAMHVIEDINQYDAKVAVFGNVSANISNIHFLGDTVNDVAVAHIDQQWANSAGLKRVKAIELEKTLDGYIPLNLYFLMGYPSTKNVLNKTLGKLDRTLYSYSLDKVKPWSKNTKLDDHIAFELDIKDFVNTDGKRVNPPHLKGMSGGPILEILVRKELTGEIHHMVRLMGVMSEWRKKDKEVVCVKPETIKFCINLWNREFWKT